jgi:hypothetical protein
MAPSPSGRSGQAEPAPRRGTKTPSGEEPVAEGTDEGVISQKKDPRSFGENEAKNGFVAEENH